MFKHLAFALAVGGTIGLATSVAPTLAGETFHTRLSGDEEVPGVSTAAGGTAIFRLSNDGSTLHYRLVVSNLEGATMSHIHIASAGENGPVVVFLFGPSEGVSKNGVLAEGEITESNLIARDGFEPTMESLLDRLRSGGAYVNVHTLAHPPGEIRGQIRAAGQP